jgi:mRNA interferase RelE/StbE
MSYTVLYHPKVKEEDIRILDNRQRKLIMKAIETRLMTEPEKYGKPLRGSLKGYWKLHVGDIRIVFKIVGNEIWILGILDRKMVYERVLKRL